MENKKLEEMTVVELKALCYDIIASQQKLQNDLMSINQIIRQKSEIVAVKE